MKDDSLSDTQSCGFCGGPLPCLTHNVNKRLGGWSIGKIGSITKDMKNILKEISVLEKEIWNKAIEAAAKYIELTSDTGEMGEMAEEVRRLKK